MSRSFIAYSLSILSILISDSCSVQNIRINAGGTITPNQFKGSYAGKTGRKQTGDWRNIMILMAYVDGFTMRNLNIENSHAWAVSFGRTINADISDVRFNNPGEIDVKGKKVITLNKDGIDLRHGCKNFRIEDISRLTSDDFIALSILGLVSPNRGSGNLNSIMVTSTISMQ